MPAKVNSIQADILTIVFYQLLLIMGFVLLLMLFKGLHKSISALGGAFAYYLPTCIFMWRVSIQKAVRAPLRFLVTFFAGESIKLVISGILFLVAVNYLHVDLLFALLGLAAAIGAFWLASAYVVLHQGAKS